MSTPTLPEAEVVRPRYRGVEKVVVRVASVTGLSNAKASRRGEGLPGFSISSALNEIGADAETESDIVRRPDSFLNVKRIASACFS